MKQDFTSMRQTGIALVLVLWILLLVTISTGAYTLMARMDSLEAHTVLWSTRARLAAEAGLHLAVLALREPDDELRWIPDGRPYEIQYGDARVQVMITDERGKLNLNTANQETLLQLFFSNGMDEEEGAALAASILDWIDIDNLVRPEGAEDEEYDAAGYDVGPGNRTFMMIEELLQVVGMPWELYKLIEPGITVWSDAGSVDPAYAPVEGLMAIPEMTREEAETFVQQRHAEPDLKSPDLALPNGQVVVASGRGLTYSIVARAALPNGVWDQVAATVRLGGSQDRHPFRILKWQEGFHH